MKKMDKNDSSKQKILNAAIKLFAQKGFDGTSIRDICKEANVNICMISYYWGSKADLYQGIIDNLIERQSAYVQTFADMSKSPFELSQKECIKLIFIWIDKIIDFFYSDLISPDIITLLLKEQQHQNFALQSPALNYFRELVAKILNKKSVDRETIFKTLFIMSQLNSAKIFTGFSLGLLGQNKFNQEDIKLIKNNLISYIKNMLKEANSD